LEDIRESVERKESLPSNDPPVTAVASRRVRPGREEEFEDWVSDLLAAVNGFPGYMGSNVIRPSDPEDDEYQIVSRFDHASSLERWEKSEERHRWLRKVEPLVRAESFRRLTGLETWFTLPSRPGEPSPPRRKMVAVTWLAVYPIVTVIFGIFGPWLEMLPLLLRNLIFTGVMVSLMTYVIMPRMTRLFSFWLYPKK
jgi:antibiotic biosynthesis monooxygenase (ABM) superfamily enzyme